MKEGADSQDEENEVTHILNEGEDDEMSLWAYRKNTLRTVFVWIGIVLTVGFLRLIFYWKPEWMVYLTHVPSPVKSAHTVVLKDGYDQVFVAAIKTPQPSVALSHSQAERQVTLKLSDPYFTAKKLKYIWASHSEQFEKLRGLEQHSLCSYFHTVKPKTLENASIVRQLYGENLIPVHLTPIYKLFLQQIAHPFYVFQAFSVILWYTDEYEVYASVILAISLGAIFYTMYNIRKMQRALRKTIHASGTITVQRGTGADVVESTELLVPGDVITVTQDTTTLLCDAVLTSGICVVNESMLTGESIPVTKTPIPNTRAEQDEKFNLKYHGRYVLFAGTHVLQIRPQGNQPITAVVLRTGFQTTKGDLVRSILYPKPTDFKFYRDIYRFLLFLGFCSLIGMVYTIVIKVEDGESAGLIARRALDLITIAVPPGLPAALVVGVVFAQLYLKRLKIYCIQPSAINLAGSINIVCFDKTGTLTEDGLDLLGVVPSEDAKFKESTKTFGTDGRISMAMATCHSLTYIKGILCGDPLEIKMFEAAPWTLEDTATISATAETGATSHGTFVKPQQPSDTTRPLEVVRHFTFTSLLQRMSVLVQAEGDTTAFVLYTKGAPEKIKSMCQRGSIPESFDHTLSTYTEMGYRVLALAYRTLGDMSSVDAQNIPRGDVEADLVFLGLIVMENRLKPQTIDGIQTLTDANIRSVMVTGDNLLTAIAVAKECRIIKEGQRVLLLTATAPDPGVDRPGEISYHEATGGYRRSVQNGVGLSVEDDVCYAMTGATWKTLSRHFPSELDKIVVQGSVFARMAPEQKAQLVEALQNIGYYVGMCGDGANDCGALKAAHSGISLSEAEASIASPFTSQTPDISCVPTLIRAGRGALVTAFGIFKFVAGYSLTQFVSVLLLYWVRANLTDWQFLYVDLILMTPLAVTYPRTEAFGKLHPLPPAVSLMGILSITSLVAVLAVVAAGQTLVYFLTIAQPWFTPFVVNDEEEYICYEGTNIFGVSLFQSIALVIAFSVGAPYRRRFFTNYWFLGTLIIITALSVWVVVAPPEGMIELFELKPPPIPFRWIIVGIGAANFVIMLLVAAFFDSMRIRKEANQLKHRHFPSLDETYKKVLVTAQAEKSTISVNECPHGFAELLAKETLATEAKETPDLQSQSLPDVKISLDS